MEGSGVPEQGMFKVPIANAFTVFGLHHRCSLHLKETRVGKGVVPWHGYRTTGGPVGLKESAGLWEIGTRRLPHNAAMPRNR